MSKQYTLQRHSKSPAQGHNLWLPQWRLLLGVCIFLTGLAVWRILLAGIIFWHSDLATMQGAAVVHWRRLDELLPWTAIAILILSRALFAETIREVRIATALGAAAAIGIVFTAGSIGSDQLGAASNPLSGIFGFLAAITMASCAAALAFREAHAIWAAMRKGGVTILDLWRFAAAQWALLAAATLVVMTVIVSKERRIGEEQMRNLLFMLPAAGVLPNAMMAAGILWWDKLLRAGGNILPVPRIRAWTVAFLLVNAGGLLLVMRGPWPGIPGTLLQVSGIILYLVGFPTNTWRSFGGKTVIAAWCLLMLALGALFIERIILIRNPTLSTFYSGAWRHLWSVGVVTLWLMGMGSMALEQLSPSLKNSRLSLASITLMFTGAALTTAVWLLTSTQSGTAQVPVMRWLVLGTGLEMAAMLLAIAGLFRQPAASQPNA